jgi:hypothetical protein
MNKDIFAEITAHTRWANIDELTESLKDAGWFTSEFLEGAVENAMKERVRKEMKSHKDADGMPLFVSIVKPDGERVYKQETLFDLDDYKQVVNYHRERGQHHINIAKVYRDRAFDRFRVRIQLSFDFEDKAKKAKS